MDYLTLDGWSPVYMAAYGTLLVIMTLRTFPMISSVGTETHLSYTLSKTENSYTICTVTQQLKTCHYHAGLPGRTCVSYKTVKKKCSFSLS